MLCLQSGFLRADSYYSRPIAPPARSKRGGKKKAANTGNKEVVKPKSEPEPEAIIGNGSITETTSAQRDRKTTQRTCKEKKPLMMDDASTSLHIPIPTLVVEWGLKDSIDTLNPGQTKEKGQARMDGGEATATGKKAATSKRKRAKKGSAKAATTPIRSESQDTRTWRPPHTLVHPSAHLSLVSGRGRAGVGVAVEVDDGSGEGVKWDENGFGCMELSALPWIAGVGYKPVEVRFEKKDVLFGESRSAQLSPWLSESA